LLEREEFLAVSGLMESCDYSVEPALAGDFAKPTAKVYSS